MSTDGRAPVCVPFSAEKPADEDGGRAAGTFPQRVVGARFAKPVDPIEREGLRRLIEHGKPALACGVDILMTTYRTSQVIPFASFAEINRESEPPIERKCIDCAGDGVITVYSQSSGEPLCTAICPTCGGTRYAP